MSSRFRSVAIATAAIASCGMSGCDKDDRSRVAELVSQLQHVREWRYDVQASRRHAPWLQANIAWDIVGAQTMMAAVSDDSEPIGSDLEDVLKSGVFELAAGPAPRNMIEELDSWRVELGKGACGVVEEASDDASWLKIQLTMHVPTGVGPAIRASIAGYAKRAADVRFAARITCGGTAALVVGQLDNKLVPLLRK